MPTARLGPFLDSSWIVEYKQPHTITDDALIALVEDILHFTPEWYDDGESFLGVAMWAAPDGSLYTLPMLREAIELSITAA